MPVGPGAARRAVVAALVVLACAGCNLRGDVPEGPVSDTELLSRIGQIEHVTDASLEYVEYTIENGDYYSAVLTVDDEADPYCIHDQASAILWQGRVTRIDVLVLQGPVEDRAEGRGNYTKLDVGPESWWSRDNLEERYGPRPAPDAVNPTPAPAPACE